MAVIGDFQEEQRQFLLISQLNPMSNLLRTGTICMNTTKNFVPLHNDSMYEKLPPYLVMHLSGHDLFYNDGSASGRVQRHFYDVQMRKSRRDLYLWLGSFPHPNSIIY